MPDLTAAVSAPRVVAIEYPLGRSLGQPGDSGGQMTVLRATLAALTEIDTPGDVVHLPFRWPEPPKQVKNHPDKPPPITGYLTRNPW